jgi:hypothetical protein
LGKENRADSTYSLYKQATLNNPTMKFSLATVMMGLLLLAEQETAAFVLQSPIARRANTGSSHRFMAADMPPPATQSNIPTVVQQQARSNGAPTDVRYSDFLRLVNAKRIEKVTFSSDGTQLLGVDVDGARLKIESLPNDPSLLTELTSHKASTIRLFIYIIVFHHDLVLVFDAHLTTHFLLYHIYFRLMSLFSPSRKEVAWANSPRVSSSPLFSLLVSSS